MILAVADHGLSVLVVNIAFNLSEKNRQAFIDLHYEEERSKAISSGKLELWVTLFTVTDYKPQ